MAEALSAPPDPLAPYVAHLWKRKWWILAAVVVAGGVGVFLARRDARVEYLASALLFIKDKAFSSPIERYPLTPATYETLLLSDDLMRKVAEAWSEASGGGVAPAGALRGRFSVRSETISDTTLGKRFSPVLELRARAGQSGEARDLLDLWARTFVREYGGLFTDEARWRVDAARVKHAAGVKRLEELEGEFADVDAQWRLKRQIAAYKQNLLAPAAAPDEADIAPAPLPERITQSIDIEMPGPPTGDGAPRGALGVIHELEIEIATSDPQSGTPQQQRELAAWRAAAAKLESEIDALNKEAADLARRRGALEAQIAGARTELQAYAENIGQLALWLEEPAQSGPSDYEGGDVKIIARPVAPDSPVGASVRRNIALIAAAALVLAMLFFIGEKYVCRALEAEKA